MREQLIARIWDKTLKRQRWFFVFISICYLSVLFFPTPVSANQNPTKPVNGVSPHRAGPIPVVNQNPVQLLFLEPIPDRAETLGNGRGMVRLTTTLTNTLISQSSSRFEAELDLEAVRTCLEFRYGVGPRWELSFSLPFNYLYAGFLDGFIYDVEKFFGNVRGVREEEDRYSFTYSVKKDGNPVITGRENNAGFGDGVIGIKSLLSHQSEMWPATSVRTALKLPTGSKGKGFGSGDWDASIGLLFEKEFRPLSLYLNTDVVFPGDAFKDEGIAVDAFYSVIVAMEYAFTQQFSVLAQFHYLSRPFQETGLQVLDRRIYDLTLGVDYRTKQGYCIQGGIVEDIIDSTDAGSDVSFFLNLGKYF